MITLSSQWNADNLGMKGIDSLYMLRILTQTINAKNLQKTLADALFSGVKQVSLAEQLFSMPVVVAA